MPNKKATVTIKKYSRGALAERISRKNGTAAIVPQVPGARRDRPLPNPRAKKYLGSNNKLQEG